MECVSKYLNIGAAGACGVGSAIGIFAGAGTPATVGAAIATFGSILWLISGIMDLAECLEAAGKQADAERFRQRGHALQAEYDRLYAMAS
jgi:hypothetical protein